MGAPAFTRMSIKEPSFNFGGTEIKCFEYIKLQIKNQNLTSSRFGNDRSSFIGWFSRTSFVDGLDSELVFLAGNQVRCCAFGFASRHFSGWYPISESIFLFYYVFLDL